MIATHEKIFKRDDGSRSSCCDLKIDKDSCAKMKIGSLFSGIGGLELGLEWSGIGRTIWQVEKNNYCNMILEKHWPFVNRYKDVKTVGKDNLEFVDLICGGFPCQDVSAAGKGAGINGTRSGLWFEFLRIVKELMPEWVVVENVAGGAKRWVDFVIRDLEQQGYETLPIPLSAADCGAKHLRRRIFIVAHSNKKRSGTGAKQTRRQAGPDINRCCKRATVANANKERLQRPRTGEELPRRKELENCDKWAIEPNVGRVANGVPNRVDRIKALGNAVVPQCAQVIGEVINQMKSSYECKTV